MTRTLDVGGVAVAPGERASIRIPVARGYTQADISLLTHVIHGQQPGPRLFVTAAVHGDELNGVEVIRRVLRMTTPRTLRGAVIAVPVVNVYGFLNQQRYVPDRRDLNRSFPGSSRGSLSARLADQFLTQIVARATHGIDLHTGSSHRTNLPHVRACLGDAETSRVARAFGTPVILNSKPRNGSLRQAMLERSIPMVLFEGGEALRFEEHVIRAGVRGVLSVMRAIGMLPPVQNDQPPRAPAVAESSVWVRAPASGIFRTGKRLGVAVTRNECLGIIANPLGEGAADVRTSAAGVSIGRTNLPVVHEGDALFHVARFDEPAPVVAQLDAFREDLESSELRDEELA